MFKHTRCLWVWSLSRVEVFHIHTSQTSHNGTYFSSELSFQLLFKIFRLITFLNDPLNTYCDTVFVRRLGSGSFTFLLLFVVFTTLSCHLASVSISFWVRNSSTDGYLNYKSESTWWVQWPTISDFKEWHWWPSHVRHSFILLKATKYRSLAIIFGHRLRPLDRLHGLRFWYKLYLCI